MGSPCLQSLCEVSIPTLQPYAVTTATENGVRMVTRIQNAVFITFVQGSISLPKWSRFGQYHAQHALWTLTYFKFRILTGPIPSPKTQARVHKRPD